MSKPKNKIAFGMIIFNGDYILKEVLESVYDFAHQILIAEGPAKYWQNKGYVTSNDRTNNILYDFVQDFDKDKKVFIVHGQYLEKDEQCNAYMKLLYDDTDYIWNLDCDEVYKQEDLHAIDRLLYDNPYTSVGIKSKTFYGGFDHYLTGFEQNNDNFLRGFKAYPGCYWQTHRPPTIAVPQEISEQINILPKKHLSSDELYDKAGVEMYHYSYVFPKQVYNKINYYYGIGGTGNRIPNYFFDVYYPWITGDKNQKSEIEAKFKGVHEYLPSVRGDCFTREFTGEHPISIKNNISSLKDIFEKEKLYVAEKLRTN